MNILQQVHHSSMRGEEIRFDDNWLGADYPLREVRFFCPVVVPAVLVLAVPLLDAIMGSIEWPKNARPGGFLAEFHLESREDVVWEIPEPEQFRLELEEVRPELFNKAPFGKSVGIALVALRDFVGLANGAPMYFIDE